LKNNVCACGGGTGSAFTDNTCICNPDQANCLGSGNTTCGTHWKFRARQQAAICAAYDTLGSYPGTGTSIGTAIRNQPDNVANLGAGGCRENVVLFFTDGAYGDAEGVHP